MAPAVPPTSQGAELRARLGAIWSRYLAKQEEVAESYQALLASIGDYDDSHPCPDEIVEQLVREEDQCAEILGELEEVFAEPDDGRE